jgi:hypothetical protein
MAETEESGTTQDDLVNYMPGMPTLSGEPTRFGRFVRSLLRRRGDLRPVVHGGQSDVVTSTEE